MNLYKLEIKETTSTKIKFNINYSESDLNINNIKLTYNNSLIQGSLSILNNYFPTFTLERTGDGYLINLINFELSCNDITTLLVKIDNITSNTIIIATCEALLDYSTSFPLLLNYMSNGSYKIHAKVINNTKISNLSSGTFILCNYIDLQQSNINLNVNNDNLIINLNLKSSDSAYIPSGKYRIKFKYENK